MYKPYRIGLLCLMLCLGAWLAWRTGVPSAALARPPSAPALVSTGGETWNMGVAVDGAPAYSGVVGRLVSNTGTFRSARAAQDTFIFPAPASSRTVEAASVYLLDRNGTYAPGTATLSLVIYNFAGVVQHTVTAADIDMQTASTGAWIELSLSANPDDLLISSGEFLGFHFRLSDAPGGDLDIHPLFEVSVR